MGILCQPVLNKTVELSELPVPSVRMALLFLEFHGRYKEWKNAQLEEKIVIIVIFLLGLCSLCIPGCLSGIRMILIFVMIILFYFATRYYLVVKERVYHLYVNVHILHHHLMGKLEVGFCDHTEPCHCVENFRSYVLKNYKISLYKSRLK